MSNCGKKYRPSNGTEGEFFYEEFCFQCLHERWVHRQKEDRDEDKCETMTLAQTCDIDAPEYPSEWTYDDKGNPTCTKFVKFDWGSGDDPHEPPPPPEPEDPRQLMVPFDIMELFPFADVVVTKTAIVEREWMEQYVHP